MNDDIKDRVLDHEYDGIREYDNKLPNWWLWTLYGAIAFAVGYWLVYHTYGAAALPAEAYEKEMIAAAEAQLARMADQEMTNEALELMSTVPDEIKAGREVFQTFCVQCHTPTGGGSVGPNLTDAYWLHGPQPLQILRTVTSGVPEKGMAAWENQLGPRRVQQVVSYVLTLRNTNVAGGKAPQGRPSAEWEAEAAAPGAAPPPGQP